MTIKVERQRSTSLLAIVIAALMLVTPVAIGSLAYHYGASSESQGMFSFIATASSIYLSGEDPVFIQELSAINAYTGRVKIAVEPKTFFKVERRAEGYWVLRLRAMTNSRPPAENRVLASNVVLALDGREVYKDTIHFILGRRSSAFYSEALLIQVGEDLKLRVWHWYIEGPHTLREKVFVAPMLRGFKLLKEYLEHEVYVKWVALRGETWWPYRCLGPEAAGKTLEGVLSLEEVGDTMLITVLDWPLSVNGVTVAYEGYPFIRVLDPLGRAYSIRFKLGFNDHPVFYILLPSRYSLVGVKVGGSLYKPRECIYGSPGENCYTFKLDKAFLNTYTVEIYLLSNS